MQKNSTQDQADILMLAINALLPFGYILYRFFFWENFGIFDFHVFHLAGVLANSGQFEAIYDQTAFSAHFLTQYQQAAQLPWFYPPLLLPYCQALALFPPATAYLLSGLLGVSVFYLAVWKAFPDSVSEIISLSVLPLVVVLIFGHPTIILLAFLFLGFRLSAVYLPGALLSLTFFAAKPHLGGVVLFLYFLRKLPQSLLPSALIALAVLATIAGMYQWDIWLRFLGDIATAGTFLQGQIFNQMWFSSAFNMAQQFGVPNSGAWVLHFAALITLSGVAAYTFKSGDPYRFWVIAGIAAVFFSPYLMFYDSFYLLFPLALVLDRVDTAKARRWMYFLLLWEAAMVAIIVFHPFATNINFLLLSGFLALTLGMKLKATPQ